MTARERRWRELIREQEQSEVSIGEFCAEQEISPASFYQWRRRLKESSAAMKFALIEPVEDNGGGEIELRLATGEALVIRPGAAAATLRMILEVMREQTQ